MDEPDSSVYAPAEDTDLVLSGLFVRRGARALEVGTGRGDIALALARRGARVEATDVNPAAVAVAAARAQGEGLQVRFFVGDLFAPVNGVFDLVVFNPPYLPTEHNERVKGPLNAAFDGGPDGLAVTRRFLAGLPGHLARGGRALTVVSSLSPWAAFLGAVPPGFEARVRGVARFPFEELRLVEVSRRRRGRATGRSAVRSPRGRTRGRSGTPRVKGKAAKGRSRPGRQRPQARRQGRLPPGRGAPVSGAPAPPGGRPPPQGRGRGSRTWQRRSSGRPSPRATRGRAGRRRRAGPSRGPAPLP